MHPKVAFSKDSPLAPPVDPGTRAPGAGQTGGSQLQQSSPRPASPLPPPLGEGSPRSKGGFWATGCVPEDRPGHLLSAPPRSGQVLPPADQRRGAAPAEGHDQDGDRSTGDEGNGPVRDRQCFCLQPRCGGAGDTVGGPLRFAGASRSGVWRQTAYCCPAGPSLRVISATVWPETRSSSSAQSIIALLCKLHFLSLQ